MAVTSSGDGNFSSVIAGGLSVNDDVIIDHDVTLDGDAPNVNSLTINPGKTFTGGGNTVTIDDKDGSAYSFRARNTSTISGTLNIKVTGNGGYIRDSATGSINNLEVDLGSSSDVHYLDTALSLAGNLTITEGIFNTNASSNHALTVGTNTDDGGATGHLLILDDGELVCNSSTVIVGSVYCQIAGGSSGAGYAELNLPDASGSFTVRGPEVSNYVFRVDNQAEINHNNGTVTFSLTAENNASIMDVTSSQGTGVNNILVTQSVRTSNGNSLQFVGSDTVKGNLTLTGNGSESCVVDTNYNGASFTIDGDVTVNNHATLCGRTTNTGNYSFGSLTINSGGTYNATSGTTTITNETSSHAWKNEGGTFTHNNGKVKFDLDNSAGSSNVKENEFYDVEVDMFASTYSLSFFDTSGNAVTILNNLDLTKGEINFSTASDTITIHGLTKVAADGTFSDNAAHDTNKIIHNGLVTNLGTYKINDGTTVKMNGGIRNLGTITVA